MDYMIMPLRRYADFSGRSRRREYWLFQLLNLLVFLALLTMALLSETAIPRQIAPAELVGNTLGLVLLAWFAVILVPMLAVQVRRLHDLDKSGWNILWTFLPYVGGFIMLYFMLARGTYGPNRYGPDPRFPDIEEVFD